MDIDKEIAEAFKRLWSIRFGILGMLFGAFAEFGAYLPFLSDFIPRPVLVGLTICCAIGSVGVQLLKPRKK